MKKKIDCAPQLQRRKQSVDGVFVVAIPVIWIIVEEVFKLRTIVLIASPSSFSAFGDDEVGNLFVASRALVRNAVIEALEITGRRNVEVQTPTKAQVTEFVRVFVVTQREIIQRCATEVVLIVAHVGEGVCLVSLPTLSVCSGAQIRKIA